MDMARRHDVDTGPLGRVSGRRTARPGVWKSRMKVTCATSGYRPITAGMGAGMRDGYYFQSLEAFGEGGPLERPQGRGCSTLVHAFHPA